MKLVGFIFIQTVIMCIPFRLNINDMLLKNKLMMILSGLGCCFTFGSHVSIMFQVLIYLFYLLCHIYPGVPHQCAALFSLGLLHYMHDKTNINQHTFSYNTVTTLTTWYIHHYMHNVNYVYMFLITVVTCRCRFMFGQHYVQCI